ncbi:MAG: hypothetical protein O3A01_04485 [bacterium]|nr:hypothetical protein [bacterium]
MDPHYLNIQKSALHVFVTPKRIAIYGQDTGFNDQCFAVCAFQLINGRAPSSDSEGDISTVLYFTEQGRLNRDSELKEPYFLSVPGYVEHRADKLNMSDIIWPADGAKRMRDYGYLEPIHDARPMLVIEYSQPLHRPALHAILPDYSQPDTYHHAYLTAALLALHNNWGRVRSIQAVRYYPEQ